MERTTTPAAARHDPEHEGAPDFPVTVVATSEQATRSALLAAREFARGLNAHITLLLPWVVSPALPLDASTLDPAIITRSFVALAGELGVDVTIQLCFCRSMDEVFASSLDPRTVVVIGGRHRRFWPGEAERMARRLERRGHRVLWVDARGRHRNEPCVTTPGHSRASSC